MPTGLLFLFFVFVNIFIILFFVSLLAGQRIVRKILVFVVVLLFLSFVAFFCLAYIVIWLSLIRKYMLNWQQIYA